MGLMYLLKPDVSCELDFTLYPSAFRSVLSDT